MPTKRLAMRNLREILRHKWSLQRSHRQIAAALGVGASTVSLVATRAVAAGLTTWADVEGLSEAALAQRLYSRNEVSGLRTKPSWSKLHQEMQRPAMTLQLLHEEYRQAAGDNAYSYTQFCRDYRAYAKTQQITMRQVHRAGEKLFVDFSGVRPYVTDPSTGIAKAVELFVAVLGASNYTYVEAVATQTVPDWLACHTRALAYYGGVPRTIVPDQLKSAVTTTCRFDPGIQRSFDELAEHYATVVMPARPRKPRDKAKVEVGVQVVQRWILMRMRHQTFFSLAELNERIAELLIDFNARPMRRYQQSRLERFNAIERSTLAPLPPTPLECAQWHKARVNLDYHVTFERHAYSVPYQHAGALVWICAKASSLELMLDGTTTRIATHVRNREVGGTTTIDAHRSRAHRMHADWSPSSLHTWAKSIGVNAEALISAMLAASLHPERTFRAAMGIVSLSRRYPASRLDAACARALAVGALRSASVKSILVRGLDRKPLVVASCDDSTTTIHEHENLRGADYYH